MKRILMTALVAALIPLSSAGAFQILTLDEMQDSAAFDGKYFQNYAEEAEDPSFRFDIGSSNRAGVRDNRPNYLRGDGSYGRSGGMFGSSQQYCSSGSSSASMTALSYGVVNSYPCQRFR